MDNKRMRVAERVSRYENAAAELMTLVKSDYWDGEANVAWTEKVIVGLVKRLRRDETSLEALVRAISLADSSTQCVTIMRPLDGRAQLYERKVIPHVVYAKMWRFPALQTHHQLHALAHCQYSWSRKDERVCINPYHYEFVDLPTLPAPVQFSSETPSISDFGQPLSVATPSSAQTVAMEIEDSIPYQESPAENNNSSPPLTLDFTSITDLLNNVTAQPSMPSPSREAVMSNDVAAGMSPIESIQYQEPPYWCKVRYWEMNRPVGEVFYANQPSLTVDGFTDPSRADQFCVGLLSNVNRSNEVTRCRRHIGKGVRFLYTGSELYIECLSDCAIFVQSQNANLAAKRPPVTVVKLQPGSSMSVFNNQAFAELLSRSVSLGYEAMHSLTHMCSIRVSLVKGWGAEYRRQHVTDTPCWLELHLSGPLQWLDRVLGKMGGPSRSIHSFT